MGKKGRDTGLDNLLELDGQILIIDPNGKHWVKFTVTRIDPGKEKPHGIDYSLTLHDASGKRLIGFDNAHPVRPTKGPGGKKRQTQDHRHRFNRTYPYEFTDCEQLLEDFWAEVEFALKKLGVKI